MSMFTVNLVLFLPSEPPEKDSRPHPITGIMNSCAYHLLMKSLKCEVKTQIKSNKSQFTIANKAPVV